MHTVLTGLLTKLKMSQINLNHSFLSLLGYNWHTAGCKYRNKVNMSAVTAFSRSGSHSSLLLIKFHRVARQTGFS